MYGTRARSGSKKPPPGELSNTGAVSPRVLFQDKDESSVASTSSNTPRKTADEAEVHLWKQVAEDIEEAGGIALFAGSGHNLSALLYSKKNPLYDSQPRRRIQSFVYRWQQWHKEGKYEEKVLNLYKVKSALVRKQEAEAKARVTKRNRKKTQPPLRPGSRSNPSPTLLVAEEDEDNNDDSSFSTTGSSPPLDEEENSSSESSFSSIHHRGGVKKRTNPLFMPRSQKPTTDVDDLVNRVVDGLNIGSPKKKARLPPPLPPKSGKRKISSPPEEEEKGGPDNAIVSPRTAGRLLPQRFKPRTMVIKGVSGGKKLPPGTGTIFRCL
jgi:hypothetical protein